MTVVKPDAVANGATIRKFRISKNISLRTVARRLELSAPYVSDMELGRRCMDYRRFIQIEAIIKDLESKNNAK